jgi:glycosyltransferase involved in cell wall biosynthesis
LSAAVTTIIPTFRRPELLRRAIQSALAQTYSDVRVCVYDNASGDETEAVVAAIAGHDTRVTYFCHQRHVDVTQNFLFGMERVQTPYFSFLSDDDVLFPGFYDAAVARLREHPDALLAAGSVIEFDQDGVVRYAPLAWWGREGRYAPPEGFFAMLGNRHPTWTGILFCRDVLSQIGKLDPQVGGPIDLDYELRVAARFPYVVFFEPSAGYVHHGDRVSSAEDTRVIAGYRRIEDKLLKDSAVDDELRSRIPERLERQMRRKLYEIAFKSVISGNDANAHAAASMLRTDFARPIAASAIDLAATASRVVPQVRGVLAALESIRLKRRSAATRARLRASIGQDGSAYARFLDRDGVR